LVSAVISQQQVQSFHDQGYVVVDFGLDSLQLDAIIEKVHGLYGADYHNNPQLPARVQDAWKKVPQVRQLAVNNNIMDALAQLLQRKPKPFQTLNFPVGTRQLPHSDTIHFNCKPQGYMVGVWVALEDIDEDNGPLIYYPGSHKLPEYNMQDFGLESSYDFYKQYEQAIQNLISEHKLEPAFGTIGKGEALIWHANLLHGGAPQNDSQRSRHSQVTHYYFENCQYYTPMLSSPEHYHYRSPEWVDEWNLLKSVWQKSKIPALRRKIRSVVKP